MVELTSVGASRITRLLLVEDDAGDALLARELLDEGPDEVDLTWVRSLAEAMAVRSGDFDCVLIDLGLPDAVGLDALHGILELAEDTAVIVFTGHNDEQRGIEAVAAGAQDYLLKGHVDAWTLTRSVRYAVERKRADGHLRELYASALRAAENTRLERGLLPRPRLADRSVRVETRYRSGRDGLLGGDFFDVVETADGVLHLLIGDVCGHGPDEAALGVCLRVAWRSLILAGISSERLLTVLEEVLVAERRDDEVFATVCIVTISPERDEATLVLAGHHAPLLLGDVPGQLPDDQVGPALGMIPGVTWSHRTISLPGSWRLMLFTDGLVEGRKGASGERLGVDGLLDLLAGSDAARRSSGDLADFLLAEARALHGEELADDVAVLMVEFEDGGR